MLKFLVKAHKHTPDEGYKAIRVRRFKQDWSVSLFEYNAVREFLQRPYVLIQRPQDGERTGHISRRHPEDNTTLLSSQDTVIKWLARVLSLSWYFKVPRHPQPVGNPVFSKGPITEPHTPAGTQQPTNGKRERECCHFSWKYVTIHSRIFEKCHH